MLFIELWEAAKVPSENMQTPQRKADGGFEAWTFLLWGSSANYRAAQFNLIHNSVKVLAKNQNILSESCYIEKLHQK